MPTAHMSTDGCEALSAWKATSRNQKSEIRAGKSQNAIGNDNDRDDGDACDDGNEDANEINEAAGSDDDNGNSDNSIPVIL